MTMSKTARRTWQKREQSAAAIFGTTRQYGSGSGGRVDETRSDSKHERLYIEGKLRASHAVLSTWREAHKQAMKERKTAVVILSEKGRHGQWLLVHEADMPALVANWLAAQDQDTACAVMDKATLYAIGAEK